MKIKYKIILGCTLLGIAIALVYWKFWGCENGCLLKSNWYVMMPYGALMGALSGNLISEFIGKEKKQEDK